MREYKKSTIDALHLIRLIIVAAMVCFSMMICMNSGLTVKAAEDTADSSKQTTEIQTTSVKNGLVYDKTSGKWYVYSNGQKSTSRGWHKLSGGNQAYVTSNGYVSAKITKSGDVRRYYTYDKNSKKFVKVTNCWKKVGKVSYYFNKSGLSTRMYKHSTKQLYLCKNKKMSLAPKGIYLMSNGKYYYVNSKGKLDKTKGWVKVSDTQKYYIAGGGYVTIKFEGKKNDEKYYKFNSSTKKWVKIRNEWKEVDGNTYYFDKNGVMQRRTIVGDDAHGYVYVDETGKKVLSKEIQLAVDFVVKHTRAEWTREKKLYECFWYMSDNYVYISGHNAVNDPNVFSGLCIDMLTNKGGNCYRYASAFACIATVLGYDARVTCGKTLSTLYGCLTPHGWTELLIDDEWMVYDVCMNRLAPNMRDYYNVHIQNFYPGGQKEIHYRYRLYATDGKVIWK
ncbi:MAG: transglutaminase domain-containing protein [Coprococcus sp.]